MQYYRFLARNVDIPGSDKHELFQVQRFDNGDIKLEVFKITKEGVKGGKLMERTFRYNETKEVRLYGFDGQDRFVINGTGKRKKTIRRRLAGIRKRWVPRKVKKSMMSLFRSLTVDSSI